MDIKDLDFSNLLEEATNRSDELNEFLTTPEAADVVAETRDLYQRYADTLNGQVIVLKEICEAQSAEVEDAQDEA